MKIKILNEKIKSPEKSYPSDAGFDVFSPIAEIINKGETKQIKLGLAVELNPDEVMITSERSGMAIKYGVTSIGNVIDANYRGEISIILSNLGKSDYYINVGDKIGQLLIIKLGNQRIEYTDELSETSRGQKAHYSSGI